MKTWYSVQALAAQSDTTEISIYDEIGFWGVNAADFSRDLKAVSTPKIKLVINSPGGSVMDALAIFNQIRATGKEIQVKVMGIAASAASYIAMAGDHIEMPENTFMWIHNPISGTYGNAEDHRAAADDLDKFGASLTATYLHRFKGEEAVLQQLLAAETLLTAAECLEYGLCDEVTPALEVSALFDVDRKMPDAVKALFAPKAAVTPPAAPTPLADLIVNLTREHGLEEFAPVFAVDATLTTEAHVRTAVDAALAVRKFCEVAGMPERAPEFVKARTPVAEARKTLAAEMVAADATRAIDTARKAKELQSPQASAMNPTDLWAQITAMQEKQRRSEK